MQTTWRVVIAEEWIKPKIYFKRASLMAQRVKNPPAMKETQETGVWSLGWEDPLEVKNGNPLQYSCLKTLVNREAWHAAAHWVPKSQTWHSDWTTTKIFFCIPFFFLLQLQCLDYVSHDYPLLWTELYSPIIHVELLSPNLIIFEYGAFLRLTEVNEVIRVGIII